MVPHKYPESQTLRVPFPGHAPPSTCSLAPKPSSHLSLPGASHLFLKQHLARLSSNLKSNHPPGLGDALLAPGQRPPRLSDHSPPDNPELPILSLS